MRKVIAAVIIAIGVFASIVPARAEGGQLQAKVLEALKSTAAGKCPERLMNALLLTECENQVDRMKQRFDQLGTIRDATYKGDDVMNGVKVEVYKVTFANGSMTWVAALGANDKLSVLWSQG